MRTPVIQENENSVTVFIYHEPLASPEETVLRYLEEHAAITNSEARLLTGIKSENSMKKAFDRLRHQGLIELVPNRYGAKSAWRRVKKPIVAEQLKLDLNSK